jgi:hypothetical protein
MELGKWETVATNSTPGNETTDATLYLKFFGAYVPVLKISSDGTLQVRKNGAWQNVLSEVALAGVLTVD